MLKFYHRHYRTVAEAQLDDMIQRSLEAAEQSRQINLKEPSNMFPRVKGATIAQEGDIFGFAFCSEKDNFNRKIGRKIAEGRLRSRQ